MNQIGFSRITKHENIFSPGGLSSKTKALLQQLARVYTPSKVFFLAAITFTPIFEEVRRMSTLKSGTAERWVNTTCSPVTPGAPPLKTLKNGPSRLQMLATKYCSIKSRLPYWFVTSFVTKYVCLLQEGHLSTDYEGKRRCHKEQARESSTSTGFGWQ